MQRSVYFYRTGYPAFLTTVCHCLPKRQAVFGVAAYTASAKQWHTVLRRTGLVRNAGYTLIEILVATALSLILLGAVVQIFGLIGGSVNDSRATLEASDRLRATAVRLQKDLAGLTVTPIPPRSPESDEGYLEIIEGPVGPAIPIAATGAIAVDNDSGGVDTTVGDYDDILMFTTRSAVRPFVGRYWDTVMGSQSTIESDTAEVAWFIRGRTLYRRVLLVVPGANLSGAVFGGFYNKYDISIRSSNGTTTGTLIANTQGDLTRRECRFAHDPIIPDNFPYDVRGWEKWGLPTLEECSANTWNAGAQPPPTGGNSLSQYDFWNDPPITNYSASGGRIAEDIILTNVIGFDVKVWDPDVSPCGAYVDLGNGGASGVFAGLGNTQSLPSLPVTARVYCTWSTHYESDGHDTNNDGVTIDEGTNGFDDDGNGIVDDAGEQETSPPYPVPLRGIQVKIRVFEPDSRQIREGTVVQDFLPK